jgi:hypothetical protein
MDFTAKHGGIRVILHFDAGYAIGVNVALVKVSLESKRCLYLSRAPVIEPFHART